jgi:hypothetical protein
MSAATSTANGDVVNFDTITTDIGSNYDDTNKKFIAPVDGYYVFNVYIGVTSPTNATRYGIDIEKNATREKLTIFHASSTGNIYVGGSYLIALAADDEIRVKAFFGDTKTINEADEYTYFEGYLLYKY